MTRLIETSEIVGLTTGLTPYHHARWQAYARISRTRCRLVELTDKDPFSVMEFSRPADSSYEKLTLFPGRMEADLSAAETVRRMIEVLESYRPLCVCLSGYATPLALGALAWCVRRRVPAILMSESTAGDEPRQAWKEWAKSRVLRLCGGALAGGAPQADYLATLGMSPERIFLGYDAVDNDYFDLGAEQARNRGSELRLKNALPEKYFLASARFVAKKNLPRLLQAYAEYRKLWLSASAEPWDLIILGDGAERDALLALRWSLGLAEHVHLVGATSYADLPTYYGLASAFIHASTTEQWGLVVNEAMASGLPVLVSRRCGCAKDLMRDGVNGFTFDPYEVADIAEKMLRLSTASIPLATFGQASREIIAHWSPARFASGLSQAIEVALSNPLPRATWLDRLLIWSLLHR